MAAHTRHIWVPWRDTLVRAPDPDTFYRLKTARNRHLVTAAEQRLWGAALLGVAGLSVGSSAATSCALTGARRFRLADADVLSLTNLNRLPGSICDIGTPKVELAARRLLEADPYTEITTFPHGCDAAIADSFLGLDTGRPLSVLIEEIDDVAMKIDLRRRARSAGIPVVSATDMGDNVVLDVERYDLDPRYPIFHGRGEGFAPGDAADPGQRLRMAVSIVGDTLTPRMAFSAAQLGRSVASWPQLGSTAAMAGALVAVAARGIVCGQPIASGRYVVDAEALLGIGTGAALWNEMSPPDIAALLTRLTGGT